MATKTTIGRRLIVGLPQTKKDSFLYSALNTLLCNHSMPWRIGKDPCCIEDRDGNIALHAATEEDAKSNLEFAQNYYNATKPKESKKQLVKNKIPELVA